MITTCPTAMVFLASQHKSWDLYRLYKFWNESSPNYSISARAKWCTWSRLFTVHHYLPCPPSPIPTASITGHPTVLATSFSMISMMVIHTTGMYGPCDWFQDSHNNLCRLICKITAWSLRIRIQTQSGSSSQ